MGPAARDRGDDAGAQVNLADHIVARIGDEEVPGIVDGDAIGIEVELGGGGLPAIARIAYAAVARDGRDHAGGEVDLADHQVARVGDEEVPGAVQRQAGGIVQLGGAGLAAVAGVARDAVARDVGDRAGARR